MKKKLILTMAVFFTFFTVLSAPTYADFTSDGGADFTNEGGAGLTSNPPVFAKDAWSLYGSAPNFTVSSQGDITLEVTNARVRMIGWASAVFGGGFDGPVNLKVYAKTFMSSASGSSGSEVYQDEKKQNGKNQWLVSVDINSAYTNLLFASATIDVFGVTEWDDGEHYSRVTAQGDHGLGG